MVSPSQLSKAIDRPKFWLARERERTYPFLMWSAQSVTRIRRGGDGVRSRSYETHPRRPRSRICRLGGLSQPSLNFRNPIEPIHHPQYCVDVNESRKSRCLTQHSEWNVGPPRLDKRLLT